jgi:DNA (cytosine-5)-methyltransferase 1
MGLYSSQKRTADKHSGDTVPNWGGTVTGLVVDLFAGGGGASVGIESALGRSVDIAINHCQTALAVHKANHAGTRHLEADIWEVRPREATGGRPVELLWASPDCTHFSIAKGDVPRSKKIRSLAWAVVRWAQEVHPSVICVENVAEFRGWGPLGADGKPNKARMGETFRRWVRRLERLSYVVDWRVLDASLYGAPTRRRRLFIVARCDGLPIEWPSPTHGPGLLPLRTAAECIDWSLPCPSIFERERPLAEKTLWRVAQGIRRFVLECPAPFLVRYNGGERGHRRGQTPVEPFSTLDCSNRFGLVSPTLVQTGYGERPGQRARVPGLDVPLGTCVDGQKHALVSAFLSRFYGGPRPVIGSGATAPVPTVTAWDHNSLAAVCLAKFRGSEAQGHPGCCDIREPLPTVAAQGTHVAEVRAFLTAYYGSDGTSGQQLTEPLRTLTARHRLGLVTVSGVDYQIVDIGLRMLQPHELLRAQFGRFAAEYDLSAARTKAAQVRLIGNSVCPEVAEAVVRANVGQERRAAA